MKKIIFFLLFSTAVFAIDKGEYLFIVDNKFSPYMSAEDFISVHRGLEKIENLWNCPINPSKNLKDVLGRFLDLAVAWTVIDSLIIVTQHEVFGHGYRVRDLAPRAEITGYEISILEGGTSFSCEDTITSSQLTAIDMGGVEADAILGNRTRMHWITNDKTFARQAIMYLLSQQDITEYIFSIDPSTINDSGHDMSSYIHNINLTYNNAHLSAKKLKNLALINFADPFTYYAIISWFKYIFTGTDFSCPMIPIGNKRYLPSFRLGLTPCGPEGFFENFIQKEHSPLYFYIRYGQHASNHYFGLGIEDLAAYTINNWMFGYRADIWHQPIIFSKRGQVLDPTLQIYVGYSLDDLKKKRAGINGSIIAQFFPWKNCGFYGELGYKTKGFLPGASLKNSPLIRAGFSTRF